MVPGWFKLSFQTTKCRGIKTLLKVTWSVERVFLRHSCAQFGTRSVRSDVCCSRHARSSIWLGNVSTLQLLRRAVHKDNAMLYSTTQTAADNSRCTVTIPWSQRVQVLGRFKRKSGEAADRSSICSPSKLLSFRKPLKRMLSIAHGNRNTLLNRLCVMRKHRNTIAR